MARRYSQDEIDYILDKQQTMTIDAIAQHLGRNPKSIFNLLKKLEVERGKNKPYSKEEQDFIKDNYGKTMTAPQIAEHLNRSLGAIEIYIQRNELTVDPHKEKHTAKTNKKWTQEQVQFLYDNYMDMEQQEIAKTLGRTLRSIQKKMSYIGLKKFERNDNWSKEEVKYITDTYEKTPLLRIAKHLNRSYGAVRAKGNELKLKRDVSTYIEREVAAILEDLGIEYQEQVTIRGFIADFVVGNKVIEVQGDYWHCNPRIYPEPKNETQAYKIKQDRMKRGTLHEEGYDILYVWELDINNNIEQVVADIEKHCRQAVKVA